MAEHRYSGMAASCAATDTATNIDDDSIAQQLYDADMTAPDLTNATEIALSGSDDVTITDGGKGGRPGQ